MIINGFNTAGKSGADLLSFGSGGADWSKVGIFNKISADQLANAYLRGDLFGLEDGFIEARKSGEYTGTFNDWRNEKLHEVFGVEYDKPSGWANKSSGNQTLDDLNNAVGAAPSTYSSGTSYLDQLTAIQNSGNAPSANMEGWADSFINKLGKAQSGGDSKEDAFNKMWASYAEGNPDHASPELQAVLRQMAGLDGGNSGNAGASMPSNPVSTPSGTSPNNGGSFSPVTTPGTFPGAGGSSSSGTGGTFPGTFPNTSGSGVGGGTSGVANDAFAQYLANVTDSGYNKQMSGSIADLENLYKDLFGNIQSGDYTKKPYYQTILESYGLAGDAAADDAVAGSVGSNGGNLDSYAAANAKRQQLAYKNAAQGAALDAYNAEIGNLIKTLGDMGVNVNDLYATWAQNLDSERGTAADVLLGQLGIDRDKYVTDAQAAVDKYLGELGLEGTKVQADADKYLGELNANLGMSQIDADKQMNADKLAAQKEIAQMESYLQSLIAEIQSATDIRKQELIKEATVSAAILETLAAKYGYDVGSLTEQNVQLLKNNAAKYGYDMEYLMATTVPQSSESKPAVEASSTEKQKALGLARNGDVDGLNEFVDSLPEEKRESIMTYVDKWKDAITEQELSDFKRYVKQAMDHGNSYDAATAYAWTQFIAKYPRRNNEQVMHNLYERFENDYTTTY